jgi:hypothetical protein
VAQGQFDQAYADWLDALTVADAEKAVPYVYNGSFEEPSYRGPFAWTLADRRVADVDIVDASGHGRVLKVEFAGRRVGTSLAKQLLVLSPGEYVLSAAVKADRIDNERGVWWRLTCADDSKQVLAATERVSGSSDWSTVSEQFVVPDTCGAEWLTFDLAARVAREQSVSGTAWSDVVAVKRVDPSAPSQ